MGPVDDRLLLSTGVSSAFLVDIEQCLEWQLGLSEFLLAVTFDLVELHQDVLFVDEVQVEVIHHIFEADMLVHSRIKTGLNFCSYSLVHKEVKCCDSFYLIWICDLLLKDGAKVLLFIGQVLNFQVQDILKGTDLRFHGLN